MKHAALLGVKPVSPLFRLGAKWMLTAALLLVVFYLLDGQALADQVQQFHLGPVLMALLIGVLQVVVSAWRWRFTAARLSLKLGFAEAVREYYLGTFLNQVLPGGMAGDASRAWRHGTGETGRGAALRAVMIERFSGQVVLAIVALASIAAVPALGSLVTGFWQGSGQGWELAWKLGLAAAVIAVLILALRRLSPSLLATFAADLGRALFSWPALAWQWLSSFLVLATYLAVYLLAARALGIGRPAWELLPLVPLVLLAMLLPISIAGWGLREGAAALVWSSAGLPPEEGVVIAVAYGVLVLIGSLPGMLVLTGPLQKPTSSANSLKPQQESAHRA